MTQPIENLNKHRNYFFKSKSIGNSGVRSKMDKNSLEQHNRKFEMG